VCYFDRLTIRPLSLEEVQGRLQANVVLVAYASLPERLLIWVVRRGEHIPRIDVPVSARALATLVERGKRCIDASDRTGDRG